MNLFKKIFNDSFDGTNNRHQQLDPSVLILKLNNCRLVRNGALITDDLWIRNGTILDPEKIFYDEKCKPDLEIDCENLILAPGFIDVQLNGAFGCDFSHDTDNIETNLDLVSRRLLEYGVTAYCPTLVSSESNVYIKLISKMKKTYNHYVKTTNIDDYNGGAQILGIHLEGPFISKEKLGAHEMKSLRTFENGIQSLEQVYGPLDSLIKNTAIITLAPELDTTGEIVNYLSKQNINVSLGHSMANLSQGEHAVEHGARFITHLFNAMLPFHHRDPHLIGLLSNRKFIQNEQIYYGVISDGIHTHSAALNIAYKSHPKGMVLVTDAMSAMGLEEGKIYRLGEKNVEIVTDPTDKYLRSAYVQGTNILCGAVATMDYCVKNLMKAIGCSLVEAIDCATKHPAKMLKIYPKKGSLNYGADADFIVIDDDLNVKATFIKGDLVWSATNWSPLFKYKFIPKKIDK